MVKELIIKKNDARFRQHTRKANQKINLNQQFVAMKADRRSLIASAASETDDTTTTKKYDNIKPNQLQQISWKAIEETF